MNDASWVTDDWIRQHARETGIPALWAALNQLLALRASAERAAAAVRLADQCIAQRDAPLYKAMTRTEREARGLTARRYDELLYAYRAAARGAAREAARLRRAAEGEA